MLMEQFELYKKRNFGDYISDTITFLRTFGKHYFGNYFKLNGWFLIILSAIIFLLSKNLIYNSIIEQNGLTTNDNSDQDFTVGIGFILIMLLITLLSLVSVTYTVIYLGLLEKHRNNDFSAKQILDGLKGAIGRMLIFFSALLLTVIPLTILFVVIFYIREMALIMIPIMIILGPALLSWISVSYFTYILERKSFFPSLKRGFEIIRDKFWPVVGSTIIISIIIQILQSAVTMIPYIVGVIIFFVSRKDLPPTENFGFLSMGISLVFVISVFAGYFLNNLLVVNQGLIYYTAQENEFNNAAHLEIDNIGTDIE
jgi:hypothetical protein